MPKISAEMATLRGRIGAHTSWANTADRTARTEPGRQAMRDKFARQVDPDSVLTPTEREFRADHARRAHYSRMAMKSAKVRSAKART